MSLDLWFSQDIYPVVGLLGYMEDLLRVCFVLFCFVLSCLHQALVAACRVFRCGARGLVAPHVGS